mmetsp:Transcript_14214/g.18988  ORF Transcript_14214/g.18988 Transcript_14214/m.18988 type:complete len:80 (-) Transcript_14214:60-299(-)
MIISDVLQIVVCYTTQRVREAMCGLCGQQTDRSRCEKMRRNNSHSLNKTHDDNVMRQAAIITHHRAVCAHVEKRLGKPP